MNKKFFIKIKKSFNIRYKLHKPPLDVKAFLKVHNCGSEINHVFNYDINTILKHFENVKKSINIFS
jgi:hypothetical protein